MTYTTIEDFKFGMDRRRPRVSGTPGTAWTLRNAGISRGGDIERLKKFILTYTLPAGTFGLGQVNGQLWTFGSADLAASMPAGVQYQRLQAPSGAAMIRVLSNNTFGGKHDVLAEFADGTIHNFYNGVRKTGWDSIAATNSSVSTLSDFLARRVTADPAVEAISSGADILITASTPGNPFTLALSTINGGATNDQTLTQTTLQPNVPAVAEARAAGTVTITGGTLDPGVNTIAVSVNAVPLLAAPCDSASNSTATATALVVAINNRSSVHGYLASNAGPVVTIRAAAGTGAAPNGFAATAVVTGNVTATTSNMTGGVTKVDPVAQVVKVTIGGTYEPLDLFTISVNGTDYKATGQASGHATSNFVYKRREYYTAGSLLYYSKLNDPSDMTDSSPSSGAGFLSLSTDTEGSDRLLSMGVYQTYMAIFSTEAVRIYSIQTDAAQTDFKQELKNTGTVAPRSVLAYGNIDVFYLDQTGIRSVQTRNITDIAAVDDAGSSIDTFVQAWLRAQGEPVSEKAVSVVDPIDGRALVAIGSRVFVFSYFPKSKISAWSYAEPGIAITEFVRARRRIYARAGDHVYLYGGLSGTEYDGAEENAPFVELPFIGARTPATFKAWQGFDIACEGVWEVALLPDPRDETKEIAVGRVSGTTYYQPDLALVGDSPLVAMRLRCVSAGPASVSNIVFHYAAQSSG